MVTVAESSTQRKQPDMKEEDEKDSEEEDIIRVCRWGSQNPIDMIKLYASLLDQDYNFWLGLGMSHLVFTLFRPFCKRLTKDSQHEVGYFPRSHFSGFPVF